MRYAMLALVLLACAKRPEPAKSRAVAISPVGMTRREFVDPARQRWDGKGPRPVTTLIWYPSTPDAAPEPIDIGPPDAPLFRAGKAARGAPPAPGRYPLVVLSHGTGGAALQLMWLGQALAAHGYVVAAVNHHGNTGAEPPLTPQGMMLIWERARDISVALDQVLADETIGPHIDPAKIGAAGFSLGGYTVVAVAGGRSSIPLFEAFCRGPSHDANCEDQAELPGTQAEFAKVMKDPLVVASVGRAGADYRDRRIRAGVLIAPAMAQIFTDQSLRGVSVPVLVIGAEQDTVAPIATNAARFAEMIPGAQLVRLESAHYTFLSECGPAGPPPLCSDPAGVDRKVVHADAAGRAVDFFNRVLQ
jgi:predicted dienelactone hydrolase